jgi:ATP-dependent Clp protease, protease subunit
MSCNSDKDDKDAWLAAEMQKMLIEKRRIFLSAAVDEKSAQEIIKNLWYLDSLDTKKPILLVINSPGGSVDSGFAIWDQVKMIKAPVYTLVTGLAASMGSILSLCAEKSKRFATKNARFMIHQPLIAGVIQGQATDLEIQAKEIIKTREALVEIYRIKTGKEKKQIEKALDRDTWMSASEAKEFNLIDEIVDSFEAIGVS